jgi:predicted nucleic acid-binding Zn ribbon protein|tara:strand:+ start:38061 stop:38351 length:291 start_codon:yes stop_codon:yes gene_type:complete
MDNDHMQSIKDALSKFLKEKNLDTKLNEHKLITMWDEVMGATISKRTSRLFIKNKILFVHVSSAPLKQELTMSKSKVLALIDEKIGVGILEDIRFL